MSSARLSSGGLLVGASVVATYAVGVTAIAIATDTHSTTAWWPAAGIGVVALMLAHRRHWPVVVAGLFVAFTLANLTAGRSAPASLMLGLGDLIQSVLVSALLLRYVGRRMRDTVDVWRLFVIAGIGALPASLIIAGVYAGYLDQPYWTTFGLILPSHAASVMLIAPLAMLRRKSGPPGQRMAWVELTAQIVLLLTATLITFGATQLTLGFAPLPVIVWAAVRFSEWVVVIEQIGYAAAFTILTQYGYGPFASSGNVDPGHSTQHAQLYLICIVLIGLPLVQAMRQRSDALARLSSSERVFRRSFTESRIPMALVVAGDGEVRFSEGNEAVTDVVRRPVAELVGAPVSSVLTGPELLAAIQEIAEGHRVGWSGPVNVIENPRIRLNGTLSLLEQGNKRSSFTLHLVDVTEPLEVQERLQAERNYTRAVVDTASSMVVLTCIDGTVIAANPATSTALGYTEEEMLGKPMWDLLAPGQQRSGAQRLFETRTLPRTGEAQLLTKSGKRLAVTFSSVSHQVSEDAPVTVVISATDVTDARQNAGMMNHLLRSARTIAFVGTDRAGRITLFNTGAEHMLGVEADAATGRELVEFIAQEDLERLAPHVPDLSTFEAIVDHAAGDLSPETRDWTWLPQGRPPLKVSMTTNPVTDTFGDLFGYLFVASDITDVRRSQEILVRALRREREVVSRLKELDNVKDDFITTVSHELRTPMSSIIGSAEMLADGMVGELTAEQHRMVEVISRNGDRLLALADDLLLLASFDHDSLPEQTSHVDLREVAEESASTVAMLVAARDLEVTYTLPDQPVLVSGDPSHLERALTNLLTNAMKFTPDGGRVMVELRADAKAGNAVLTVADTGLGIPEADQEHIFDRFFRSSLVQEAAIQGSGLGLSIVKTIVESHEGRIDLSSTPGTGTTFTVTLPLVRVTAPLSGPASSPCSGPGPDVGTVPRLSLG